MDKKYLTTDEIQNIFRTRMEEYSSRPDLGKMIDPIRKGFVEIIGFLEKGAIKVYQLQKDGGVHTFMEIHTEGLSPNEIDHLGKVSNFILKVDAQCGYLPLS